MKDGRNSKGHCEEDWSSMIGSVDVKAIQNYKLLTKHSHYEVKGAVLLPGSPFAIAGKRKRKEKAKVVKVKRSIIKDERGGCMCK